MSFPDQKYNIIHADPPWSFDNKKTGGSMKSGASQQYDCMEMHELTGMVLNSDPVVMLSDIIADDCYLFMWWVGTHAKEAIYLAEDWGFKLYQMNEFVWDKRTKHGKHHFGMGWSTHAGTETCLLATRGKLKRLDRAVRAYTSAPMPVHPETGRYIHSAKPQVFADKIVQLYGDIPRIELFARDKKPGWDSWGNEV